MSEELCFLHAHATGNHLAERESKEINQLLKHETTRLGEDMATKVEIARITAQEEIESLTCVVVHEILDVIFSQVEGRRSTLGPRWVIGGSPIFGGHPWVPAEN